MVYIKVLFWLKIILYAWLLVLSCTQHLIAIVLDSSIIGNRLSLDEVSWLKEPDEVWKVIKASGHNSKYWLGINTIIIFPRSQQKHLNLTSAIFTRITKEKRNKFWSNKPLRNCQFQYYKLCSFLQYQLYCDN